MILPLKEIKHIRKKCQGKFEPYPYFSFFWDSGETNSIRSNELTGGSICGQVGKYPDGLTLLNLF